METDNGKEVRVHYTGRLEDGTVFDTSEGREPLSFMPGAQQVIPGFEDAAVELAPGETTTTTIQPGEGYGDRREDLVIEVEREQISGELTPEVGQQLQLTLQDGQQVPVTVTKVEEEAITIDANHPLAGKTLVFEIERV